MVQKERTLDAFCLVGRQQYADADDEKLASVVAVEIAEDFSK